MDIKRASVQQILRKNGAEKDLSDPSKIFGIVAQKPIKFFVFKNTQLRGNVMILHKPLVPNKRVCQQNLSESIF